jgi:hypothetical protein
MSENLKATSHKGKRTRTLTMLYVVTLAIGIIILVPLLIGQLTEWHTFSPFFLIPPNNSNVIGLLTSLFVVTLVMERSLEVFVATIRQSRRGAMLDKNQTRFITLWAGLLFGIIISVVGIRTLGSLVDPEIFKRTDISALQKYWFNIVDIFITGGLLAGGSDSIHKMTKIYTTFMDAAAQKYEPPQSTPTPTAPAPAEQESTPAQPSDSEAKAEEPSAKEPAA